MNFQLVVTIFRTILNSSVFAGFYFGVLTLFSIRPSYLFLFVEEPEKKVAAISGVILGQLVRFLSIYNAPLHRLLCIPHAITAFFLPYLVISYLCDNFHSSFTISTTSTFSFFLNSFLFQLSNQIIFPSSLSARLGHIYLFRCKNKLDFLTGSFVGWSIAQICLLLFLHRLFALLYKYRLRSAQNQLVSKLTKSITKYLGEAFPAFLAQGVSYYNTYSNKIYQYLAKYLGNDYTDLVRDCEWFVSEVQYLVLIELPRNTGRVITLLLYLTCAVYATRMPTPTMSYSHASSVERTFEPSDLTRQLEQAYSFIGLESTSMKKSTRKRVKKEFQEYPKRPVWGAECRDVDLNEVEVGLIKPAEVPIEDSALGFYAPDRWTHPARYIRNLLFMGAVQEKDVSEYFFDTCRSDGKERLAFTYLPALSFFKKMMKRIRIASSKVARPSFDKLDKNWINKNKKKKQNLNNEFKKRIEALDAGFRFRDILDKRTRVCTDQTLKTCLPIKCDPLLNGPHRGRIKELDSALDVGVTSEVPTIQIAPRHRDKVGETHKLLDSTDLENFDVRDLTETISLLPQTKEDEKSQPTDQTSQPSQLGKFTLPHLEPEDPVITYIEYCLDLIKKSFKKIYQPRRRKKISKSLYSQFLEYQARRRKNRKTFKSQAPRRKNRKTFKSREREIIQPRERGIIERKVKVRKFFEINRLIDLLLPGCLPHSPKYPLRTRGLLERTERLAKSKKLFSNPLAKLFQRLAKSKKLFSNPLAKLFHGKRNRRVDSQELKKKGSKLTRAERKKNYAELKEYAELQQEDLDEEIWKEIPRWKWLLITELQKELNVDTLTAPGRKFDKEDDYEISSYKLNAINLSNVSKKKSKENKETEQDEKTEKTDTKIDEKTEKTDTKIDEKTEKIDTQIDEKNEKTDTQIDEKNEKTDTQIDEKNEKTDTQIDEKTEKTDTQIDEKNEKTDTQDEKTKKKKKTREEIEEEILNEIIERDRLFEEVSKETEDETWNYEFSKWKSDLKGYLKGSPRFLERKRLFLRWVEPFSHSPLFYGFTRSRLDIYFKFRQVKALVKKGIDRFKRLISKKGPLEKTKRKIDEKERKEREKGKERKKREKGKERKIDEKERKERIKRKKLIERKRLKRKITKIARKFLKFLKFLRLQPRRKKSPEEYSADEMEFARWAAIDEWETHIENGLGLRSCLLFFQAILRKFVRLPLLIIVKNSFRFLLFQKPEWSEDFEDWQTEVHVLSDNLGNITSEVIWWSNWPEYWFEDGFQIKVVRPFSLKPWHTDEPEKFQTGQEVLFIKPFSWGLAPFAFSGDSAEERSFLRFFWPIWDALKPIGKDFRILDRRLQIFFVFIAKCIKVLRKATQFVLNCITKCIKVLRKFGKTTIKTIETFRKKMRRFRRVDESSETKKEKDSRIRNERIQESVSEIDSTFEEEIKNMMDRTNTINNQIEILRKEKIKVTPGLNKNGESPKNIWKMFKRRKVRLINKFHYFQNCLIEKIYQICLDIVLSIINIERITEKTNKKRIFFSKNFLKFFVSPDLSSLSQAYVFYKLSQSQVSDKVRSVLQYRGTSFFLKTEIKESFERQGIFHSELKNKTELKNKKLRNLRTNPWKNWLRCQSHYTLSKRRWSELKDEFKWYKLKAQLIWSKLKAQLPKKKEQNGPKKKEQNGPKKKEQNRKNKIIKAEKNYKYNLLASKFLSSETKKDSYIAKQQVSCLTEKDFLYVYLNYQCRPLPAPTGSPVIPIFEIDVVDAIDPFLATWDSDEILFGPYPSTSLSGVILLDAARIEEPTLDEQIEARLAERPIERTTNEKIDNFLNWMGMNEDLDPDYQMVNSRDENWFVRHVLKPAQEYNKKPWIRPRELLFRNLPVRRKLVSAKELKEFKKEKQEQKKKEKKEKIKAPPILCPELRILRDPLENAREEQEQKDNIQEAFTNVYEKMLREKQEELFSERTGREKEFLVSWTDSQMDRFYCSTRKVLKIMFAQTRRLSKKRKILFKFWKLGVANVDNMIFPANELARQRQWIESGAVVPKHYAHAFMQNREQLIMYQAISIALDHKMKLEKKDNFDLLVPEMILSSRRRRELRILNSLNFNFKNRKDVDRNRVFCKENKIKSWGQFLDESKDRDREKNEFIKFKFFLWPNFRLEDLACMNRYWFDTSNGSRFSMLRLYMYPRFKIRWW